jgi:hypothetical protein
MKRTGPILDWLNTRMPKGKADPEETTPPITAEQAVQVVDGVPMINSRDVAAMFDKRHDHVLRDIQEIISRADEEALPNFGESSYINEQNKQQPCYLLTRDGFSPSRRRRVRCGVLCGFLRAKGNAPYPAYG